MLKQKSYYLFDIEDIEVDEATITSLDIENIQFESLLFQAGYLTIDKIITDLGDRIYMLRFPNKQIQLSLARFFIKYFAGSVNLEAMLNIKKALYYEDIG